MLWTAIQEATAQKLPLWQHKKEFGRGERIRTSGPCLPKTVLYQAELLPDRSGADEAAPRQGGPLDADSANFKLQSAHPSLKQPRAPEAEVASVGENQMIDQVDAQKPQKSQSFPRPFDVGPAGAGVARGMIVGHQQVACPDAERCSPMSRGNRATIRLLSVDRGQGDEPFMGIECREQDHLPIARKQGAQQQGRDLVLRVMGRKAVFKYGRCRVEAGRPIHSARCAPAGQSGQVSTGPEWTWRRSACRMAGAGLAMTDCHRSESWSKPSIMNCNIST